MLKILNIYGHRIIMTQVVVYGLHDGRHEPLEETSTEQALIEQRSKIGNRTGRLMMTLTSGVTIYPTMTGILSTRDMDRLYLELIDEWLQNDTPILNVREAIFKKN